MSKFAVKSTALLLALGFAGTAMSAESLQDVMKRRNLNQQDLLAAAKTYVPTGKRDEFLAFSSGGQSGQVIVYGIPSMRILKYIGVFTPEPWQGYGFDENSKSVLKQGWIDGKEITWGDTHHPAISETQGKYDGQFLFINDKANPRLAVIDLRDFETKQIVVNPIFKSEHGGAFVTPNTEYVIEAAQYASPLENKKFYPLEEFNEKYRGGVTYWKFDRKEGRIDVKESFTVELPPYSQDLSDAGKGPSDGWSFTNSFCSERYVGGIEKGRPPYEAGCSAKDTDYLHVINWKKAAELVAQGKAKKINGHNVLMMETAIKEGILFLIPEPKSPHGVDVTPDGTKIVVSGKLDTHVSVYSFEKIMAAIKAGKDAQTDVVRGAEQTAAAVEKAADKMAPFARGRMLAAVSCRVFQLSMISESFCNSLRTYFKSMIRTLFALKDRKNLRTAQRNRPYNIAAPPHCRRETEKGTAYASSPLFRLRKTCHFPKICFA